MLYSAPRGTRDILPDETPLWQAVEQKLRAVFALYNYHEIRTPIFESTELFTRSIGTSTDIVGKEMYTFQDRKNRSLTLRPEATAPVVRACLENNLLIQDQVVKLYYFGPMFRYERPQAGRQRQFHQAGVEVFGSASPRLDVEVIGLNLQLLQKAGITDLEVNVNSVGCKTCRPVFREKLKTFLAGNISKMCKNCQERYESNPLRVLDCKEPGCQGYLTDAPSMREVLCPECEEHFAAVLTGLQEQAVVFKTNPRLVRGLDYYTKTTFEITSSRLGAQNALSGGGRYDTLVEELGGKSTPAIGFAIGMERLIEVIKSEIRKPKSRDPRSESRKPNGIILFIALLGEKAKQKGFTLLNELRQRGISADMDYSDKSLKSQMKMANKIGAQYVYIIGEEELTVGCGILKEMHSGEQKAVEFEKIKDALNVAH